MVQQSLGWRLRRLGLSFIRDHKDVTNAFGSTSFSSLAASNDTIMRDHEARFGRHRFLNAAVCFQGPEGILFAKPNVGALQGDPWAVKVFTRDIGT
eukprot:9488008-Pyramimonas_sp.AAC.1